ncbi:NAD(P)H-quinone oxidoreductase subunit 2, chloroplastic [uncultured archaeon]|nr:NAD(P)H-quinone oxidoreductase subunit 2, chloroplastic [uncultured archaeon]
MILAYHSKEIQKITGAVQVFPIIGPAFLLTTIGLAGSLPFGMFFSEIALLAAALAAGQYAVAVAVIVLTIVAFGSFLLKASGMVYGPAPAKVDKRPIGLASISAMAILFILAILTGFLAPILLSDFIRSAAATALGGF